MKLYAVISQDKAHNDACDASLNQACERIGIDYHRVIAEQNSLDDIASMPIEEGSLLYRISLSPKAAALEAGMAFLHADKLTGIFHPTRLPYPQTSGSELWMQLRSGLGIIPTSIVDETWRTFSRQEIDGRVEALGGYPVILKRLGQSHGQGVNLIDSLEELDKRLQSEDFSGRRVILRRYLPDYHNYRLIVVDGNVVAAVEYHKPDDDFRTNASPTPIVTPLNVADLDPVTIDLAVRGVAIRSSILGGVDILVEKPSGIPYLAEVNAPCNFARVEAYTGIDIAGQLLAALQAKQKKERGSHV